MAGIGRRGLRSPDGSCAPRTSMCSAPLSLPSLLASSQTLTGMWPPACSFQMLCDVSPQPRSLHHNHQRTSTAHVSFACITYILGMSQEGGPSSCLVDAAAGVNSQGAIAHLCHTSLVSPSHTLSVRRGRGRPTRNGASAHAATCAAYLRGRSASVLRMTLTLRLPGLHVGPRSGASSDPRRPAPVIPKGYVDPGLSVALSPNACV